MVLPKMKKLKITTDKSFKSSLLLELPKPPVTVCAASHFDISLQDTHRGINYRCFPLNGDPALVCADLKSLLEEPSRAALATFMRCFCSQSIQ